MTMAFIQIRISSEEKEATQEVLENMGLNFSSAIKLFFKKTVQEKKLPFELVAEKTSRTTFSATSSSSNFKMQEWSGFSRHKIG